VQAGEVVTFVWIASETKAVWIFEKQRKIKRKKTSEFIQLEHEKGNLKSKERRETMNREREEQKDRRDRTQKTQNNPWMSIDIL